MKLAALGGGGGLLAGVFGTQATENNKNDQTGSQQNYNATQQNSSPDYNYGQQNQYQPQSGYNDATNTNYVNPSSQPYYADPQLQQQQYYAGSTEGTDADNYGAGDSYGGDDSNEEQIEQMAHIQQMAEYQAASQVESANFISDLS